MTLIFEEIGLALGKKQICLFFNLKKLQKT